MGIRKTVKSLVKRVRSRCRAGLQRMTRGTQELLRNNKKEELSGQPATVDANTHIALPKSASESTLCAAEHSTATSQEVLAILGPEGLTDLEIAELDNMEPCDPVDIASFDFPLPPTVAGSVESLPTAETPSLVTSSIATSLATLDSTSRRAVVWTPNCSQKALLRQSRAPTSPLAKQWIYDNSCVPEKNAVSETKPVNGCAAISPEEFTCSPRRRQLSFGYVSAITKKPCSRATRLGEIKPQLSREMAKNSNKELVAFLIYRQVC
ncbi:hypothetical protein EV177_004771 [Coemansia sp. RSA 1804]|nr:hypothetical protein EV177_004771 [Coemansia sp. RSA 1804]